MMPASFRRGNIVVSIITCVLLVYSLNQCCSCRVISRQNFKLKIFIAIIQFAKAQCMYRVHTINNRRTGHAQGSGSIDSSNKMFKKTHQIVGLPGQEQLSRRTH